MEIAHLVTHSGFFHADDVFAFTVLSLVYPSAQLVRTRDNLPSWTQNHSAILFDVGGTCDHVRIFDHHHIDPSLVRPSGVSYSSAGLIWKQFGLQSIRAALPLCLPGYTIPEFALQSAWTHIDQIIVEPLDFVDTTGKTSSAFDLSAIVANLNPGFPELSDHKEIRHSQFQSQFLLASQIIRTTLLNTIRSHISPLLAIPLLQTHYSRSQSSTILVIPSELAALPVDAFLLQNPQILFVIRQTSSQVSVSTTPIPGQHFSTQQIPLPSHWGGLSNSELAHASGIPSARFCHKNLFYAVFGSLDDALHAVHIALQSAQTPTRSLRSL